MREYGAPLVETAYRESTSRHHTRICGAGVKQVKGYRVLVGGVLILSSMYEIRVKSSLGSKVIDFDSWGESLPF